METGTLIKLLEGIIHKLNHRTYVEERSFIGTIGEKVELPSVTRQKYHPNEIMNMHSRKTEIVQELYKRGVVDDDGYAEFFLSEDPTFIPEFILTIDK